MPVLNIGTSEKAPMSASNSSVSSTGDQYIAGVKVEPGWKLMAHGYDWSWAYVVHRDIPGFPGYCVGTDGSVWTRRNNRWGIGDVWRRMSSGTKGKYGHRSVHLRPDGGGSIAYSIHRLVLDVFVGPAAPGMEGCHINHRPEDNSLANLHWGTPTENRHETIRAGRFRTGGSKLSPEDVSEIRRLVLAGVPRDEIASRFGISSQMIKLIVRGKSWSLHESDVSQDDLKRVLAANKARNIAKGRAALSDDVVRNVRRLAAAGVKQREIMRQTGLPQYVVSNISLRKTYCHVPD